MEQSEYIRNTVTLGLSQLHRDLKVGVKGAHAWRTRTCRERGSAAPRTKVPLSQSTGSAPAGRATQSLRGSVWPKEEVHRPGPLLCNPEGQARQAVCALRERVRVCRLLPEVGAGPAGSSAGEHKPRLPSPDGLRLRAGGGLCRRPYLLSYPLPYFPLWALLFQASCLPGFSLAPLLYRLCRVPVVLRLWP